MLLILSVQAVHLASMVKTVPSNADVKMEGLVRRMASALVLKDGAVMTALTKV